MRKIVAVTLMGAALGIGVLIGTATRNDATAQEKSQADQAWNDTTSKELAAETEALSAMAGRSQGTRQAMFAVADAYRDATRSPDGVRGLVAKSVNNYLVQKASSRVGGGPGVAEAQLRLSLIQIHQNERIIALLEELRKRP